jgi:hypothetical protein
VNFVASVAFPLCSVHGGRREFYFQGWIARKCTHKNVNSIRIVSWIALEYSGYKNINSVALVRKLTIPTERPSLACEVNASFADIGCRVVSATDPPRPSISII